MKQFVINKFDSGQTLEKYIKKLLKNAPLSFIYRIFRKKDIKVNGKRENGKYIINENDEIAIYITDAQYEEFIKETPLLANDSVKKYIIYEDDNILIINKPRNMLVQKDDTNEKALDGMVKEYMLFKGVNNSFLASPVHRIDRNTSGLVIFAKSLKVDRYLSEIIKDHKLVNKTYLALVKGKLIGKGKINVPLKKNEKLNKVYVSSIEEGGKESLTEYESIFSGEEYSLLKVKIFTGRSHQIRVHLSSINHPVIGDEKYGNFEANKIFKERFNFKNQFLHAREIKFTELEEPLKYLSKKNFIGELPIEEEKILEIVKGENA